MTRLTLAQVAFAARIAATRRSANDEAATKLLCLPYYRIMNVYSGQAGKCCCGCAGKHTYLKEHQALGSRTRGYVVTDNEVSDRSVKTILNKMQKLVVEGAIVEDGGSYLSVETESRVYIAYLADAS